AFLASASPYSSWVSLPSASSRPTPAPLLVQTRAPASNAGPGPPALSIVMALPTACATMVLLTSTKQTRRATVSGGKRGSAD
ncbi:unnamed protein product, partial [Closterium sp. NIES-54]